MQGVNFSYGGTTPVRVLQELAEAVQRGDVAGNPVAVLSAMLKSLHDLELPPHSFDCMVNQARITPWQTWQNGVVQIELHVYGTVRG